MLPRGAYHNNGQRNGRDEMEANINARKRNRDCSCPRGRGRESLGSARCVMILTAWLALCGCQSGETFRTLHLDADLRPGDLSYYQDRARNLVVSQPEGELGQEHLTLEEGFEAFPMILVPLFWSSRRTYGDLDASAESYSLSVQHTRGVLLALFTSRDTAKFDPQGVNLSGRRGRGILFGLLAYGFGHEVVAENTRATTSAFSILFGCFSTARTPRGRNWTVFWFPVIGVKS